MNIDWMEFVFGLMFVGFGILSMAIMVGAFGAAFVAFRGGFGY